MNMDEAGMTKNTDDKYAALKRSENENRIKRWEEIGEVRIESDLNASGFRLVGGTPEVRKLAQLWLDWKKEERKKEERKVTFGKIVNHQWTLSVGGGLAVVLIVYIITQIFSD